METVTIPLSRYDLLLSRSVGLDIIATKLRTMKYSTELADFAETVVATYYGNAGASDETVETTAAQGSGSDDDADDDDDTLMEEESF